MIKGLPKVIIQSYTMSRIKNNHLGMLQSEEFHNQEHHVIPKFKQFVRVGL